MQEKEKDPIGMTADQGLENSKKIRLPFIMACVRDSESNMIFFDSHPKYLKMTSLEKMRCFGDGDVLRLMKFDQVPCHDFEKFIGVDGRGVR